MHLNFRQKERFKKQEEATGDLIRNKIADKITTASKTSPKSNSETNEEKKIIHISRTKTKNYWWLKIKGRKFLLKVKRRKLI